MYYGNLLLFFCIEIFYDMNLVRSCNCILKKKRIDIPIKKRSSSANSLCIFLFSNIMTCCRVSEDFFLTNT